MMRQNSNQKNNNQTRMWRIAKTSVVVNAMVFGITAVMTMAMIMAMASRASAQTLVDLSATMGINAEIDAKNANNASAAKKHATSQVNAISNNQNSPGGPGGQNGQNNQVQSASALLAASANATRPMIKADPAPERGQGRTMLITSVLVVGVIVASIMSSKRHLDN